MMCLQPRPAPLLAVLLPIVAGCPNLNLFSGSLDTPGAIAVLPVGQGPFTEPVGYVANRTGGEIRVLALAQGRYLSDVAVGSFLRGHHLGTGYDRLLAGVAAYAPDADHASVFVIDKRFRQLLRVPHVDGRTPEGHLNTVQPVLAAVTWNDADGSGNVAELAGLAPDPDTAASETWTITFTGTAWEIEGSRSGLQRPAPPGVLWSAYNGALSFVPRGEATRGDQFVVQVNSGITEIPLAGDPIDLSIAPDQRWLALVHDAAEGAVVRLVDPATSTIQPPLSLPVGARPGRTAWSPDGRTLFVAEGARSAAWSIDVDSGTVTEIPLPWPTLDVALLVGESTRHLHVVPASGTSVWVHDLDAGALIDLNPATAEVEGMRFLSPVTGISAMPTLYDFPNYSKLDDNDEGDDDLIDRGRSVAVSLHAGKVVWMREGDGCLVPEPQGPRTQVLGSSAQLADYEPDFDIQVPGTAFLDAVEDDVRHVSVNPCAGLAPSETWELVFDGTVGAWRVRGTTSGDQVRLAYEEERYVSDAGTISFTMRAGTTPSEDGWRLRFNVLEGALRGDGDNQDDRVREVNLDLPGRPAAFYARQDGEDRAWVVVSASGSDIVVRISANDGLVDSVWQ